jgi:hypothetical protein
MSHLLNIAVEVTYMVIGVKKMAKWWPHIHSGIQFLIILLDFRDQLTVCRVVDFVM